MRAFPREPTQNICLTLHHIGAPEEGAAIEEMVALCERTLPALNQCRASIESCCYGRVAPNTNGACIGCWRTLMTSWISHSTLHPLPRWRIFHHSIFTGY